jgi:hypothetical protein
LLWLEIRKKQTSNSFELWFSVFIIDYLFHGLILKEWIVFWLDHNINVFVDISKSILKIWSHRIYFFSLNSDLLNIKQIFLKFQLNDLYWFHVVNQVVVVFHSNMLLMHQVQVIQIVVVNIRLIIMLQNRLINVKKVFE